MNSFLVLRFDAPLMSFGDVRVDAIGRTRDFPGQSMITGLIGNALGYDYVNPERLQSLQGRLTYGVRVDHPGSILCDYQIAQLQDVDVPWTTRGVVDAPEGSGKDRGHIRQQEYITDAVYTVVVRVSPGRPTFDDLIAAFHSPARPLFLGRKCCVPARPIFDGVVKAETLCDALAKVPYIHRTEIPKVRPVKDLTDFFDDYDNLEKKTLRLRAFWPESDGPETRIFHYVCDQKDWSNQILVGRRIIFEGTVSVEAG